MIFSFWRTFFFWITICWTYKRKCHYVELLMLTHLKIMKTILIKIKFLLNLLHSTKTISEEQCESCMQNNYSTELWGILKTAGNKSQKISWSFFFLWKGKRWKYTPFFEQQLKFGAGCLDSLFEQRAEHNTWHIKLLILQTIKSIKRNNCVGCWQRKVSDWPVTSWWEGCFCTPWSPSLPVPGHILTHCPYLYHRGMTSWCGH